MLTHVKTYSDFHDELAQFEAHVPVKVLREGEYLVLENLLVEIEEAFELFNFLSPCDYEELIGKVDRILSSRRVVVC